MLIEWLTFVVVMALGQFSPGPDMILLTRIALADGLKAGCATAAGIATGLTFHASIAIGFIGGLASLLDQGGALVMTIYTLAASYLLWIAYSLLKSVQQYRGAENTPEQSKNPSLLAAYQKGLLCNLLNPKVALFLASIMLPFITVNASVEWRIILWATIFLEGLILWCLWVRLLQLPRIRQGYAKNSHVIDTIFALTLIGLAGMIIYHIFNT